MVYVFLFCQSLSKSVEMTKTVKVGMIFLYEIPTRIKI